MNYTLSQQCTDKYFIYVGWLSAMMESWGLTQCGTGDAILGFYYYRYLSNKREKNSFVLIKNFKNYNPHGELSF